jgi:hypothetical protein|tara:strand:- start:4681 stop:4857 length:177 start_codon:yes stop_codon:yes gene_type:complete
MSGQDSKLTQLLWLFITTPKNKKQLQRKLDKEEGRIPSILQPPQMKREKSIADKAKYN